MMKNSVLSALRVVACLLCVGAALAVPSTATAAEDLLVIISEEVASAEGDTAVEYWWASSAPQWTATDVALREAMRGEGTGFAEPRSLADLSRIYRVPKLSETSAVAMASVFDRRRVLAGSVTYAPTRVSPLGVKGWRASVDVRLLEGGDAGPVVRHEVSFTRARWGRGSDEALAMLRNDVAEQIARSVAGGLGRKIGPVGVDTEEVLFSLRSADTRANVEAIIARLETFAGVADVGYRWAAEGQIVLEVNPAEVDPEASIRQYAGLLVAEEFEDFRLTTVDGGDPKTIVFGVEEITR